ncbi:MAG: hypothetical protein JXR37_23865 [Kiritimatiellae bacterium]|nr:hypothetical protein [Kiritimatiellia bacterium]
MSRMLTPEPEDDPKADFGAKLLVVEGRPVRNSAAKFWSHLIDELAEDWPDCDRVVLCAPLTGLLDPEMLCPANSLQDSLDRMAHEEPHAAIQEALAELVLLGPPGAVRITMLSRETELESREFPSECLDAEIFPLVAVWLLEWAAIPAPRWNTDFLEGTACALDPLRGFTYRFDFLFRRIHVSEGLYNLQITLDFARRNPGNG